MGIQVGFYLNDLIAAADRAGAKADVLLSTIPDSYEDWEDQYTGETQRVFIAGGRNDRIRITMPDGRGFVFGQSFDTAEGIRIWFSNKNVNHELREMLDELKVPYDRG